MFKWLKRWFCKEPPLLETPPEKPEWEIERDLWVGSIRDGQMLFSPEDWPTEEEWPFVKRWIESNGKWPDPYMVLVGKDSEEQVVYDYWYRASSVLWGKDATAYSTASYSGSSFPEIPKIADMYTNPASGQLEPLEGRKPLPPHSGFWYMRKAAPLSHQEQKDLEAVRAGKLSSGIAITAIVPPELRKREKLYKKGAIVFIDKVGNIRRATKKEKKLLDKRKHYP